MHQNKKSFISSMNIRVLVSLLLMLSVVGHAVRAEATSSLGLVSNNSSPTTCAEEDNINVPIFNTQGKSIRVTATHPMYTIGTDNCSADFSGCSSATTEFSSQSSPVCTKLWDDSVTVAKVCTDSGWWRPYNMKVTVNGKSGTGTYLQLYKKISGVNSWPQFFVLYEDGNLRLKPQPKAGQTDNCFGSSVIVGPAAPANRPFVDIASVDINTVTRSILISYASGEKADITYKVDRDMAILDVRVAYSVKTSPLVTFRSMWVKDGKSDVDHMTARPGDYQVLGGWTSVRGPWWFFYRDVRSTHNTSAPDIMIEALP